MSEGTFGQLVLPVPVPAARNDLPITIAAKDVSLADPALDTLLSFIQAVLDYELTTAWAIRAPGSQVNKAARFTSTNDPTEGEFNDNQLPGLFLWRQKGDSATKYAADMPSTEETIILQWVFPPGFQHTERARNNIINGLSKALILTLEHGVHPAWTVASDNAAPAAIRLAGATPLAPTVYSGVALNGLVGGGTVNAARPVTVTTVAGSLPTFNTTDPIVITGTLPTGQTGWTESLYLTLPLGGETISGGWNLASVQSIAVPAQLLSTGSWTFGYAASPEKVYGSPVRRYAGFTQLRCQVGQRKPIKIKSGKDIEYDCVEFVIKAQELYTLNPANLQPWSAAVDGIGIRIEETIAGDPAVYQTADLDA